MFFTYEVQIKFILKLYGVTHVKDVQNFLERNKFLAPLLLTTYINIIKYFSCSKVSLNVEIDYEDSRNQELVAHVVTKLPLEEAYQQLKQFDEQWWLKIVDQAQLKFYINLEFE